MSKREFGEPIKMRLVEEDTLVKLLELWHRKECGDRDEFEYFWDMMEEIGSERCMSHREFVVAVKNMTFEKLAKMDLALYDEYTPSDDVEYATWTGRDGDQCSHCGRRLHDLMDCNSWYSSEFENMDFSKLKACPFCGARMKK